MSYSVYAQQGNKIPADIQKKIDEAVDYYNLYLFDDSKKLLLELLYSDEGEKYEAEIRYHLGIASHTEGFNRVAGIQWNMLRKKYPTSQRSQEISRAFGIMIQDDYWFMYYEGRGHEWYGSINLAKSSDGLNWNKMHETNPAYYPRKLEIEWD